ncbi:hypothetical protein TPE_0409 [Treponema pedis str. T A4]|uniref:Uncharacterized protein n=1 Tax=Treponema pedis str. T A4 TaxID=1291379 RepID=S5ZS65_9SPIR|nr:hypothetical protein TPE_0409 [Treponema pedis str. T A4]
MYSDIISYNYHKINVVIIKTELIIYISLIYPIFYKYTANIK